MNNSLIDESGQMLGGDDVAFTQDIEAMYVTASANSTQGGGMSSVEKGVSLGLGALLLLLIFGRKKKYKFRLF